jgi:15-cis-phytoene synthase
MGQREKRARSAGMKGNRTPTVTAAYAYCRAIAKREAKNFYWAFRVLPQHKSDAMCAVYAFMRKADDLSDDESLSLDQRRAAMAAWTEAWRASRAGQPTGDPVFVALNDTQQRFGIPDSLLEELVAGTTMDLETQPAGVVSVRAAGADGGEREYQVYESFDALYRYCYLVASVVGLVCIRIFGYSDPRAEMLAERTGVAFQLTNILRDVREDAERGRIYLPLDDMAEMGLEPPDILAALREGQALTAMQRLLAKEIGRAREYYRAADQLVPLLDADAQPAMEVLATIYRRLLERVAREPDAVLRERVSVHISEKLGILGRGLIASGMTRLGA